MEGEEVLQPDTASADAAGLEEAIDNAAQPGSDEGTNTQDADGVEGNVIESYTQADVEPQPEVELTPMTDADTVHSSSRPTSGSKQAQEAAQSTGTASIKSASRSGSSGQVPETADSRQSRPNSTSQQPQDQTEALDTGANAQATYKDSQARPGSATLQPLETTQEAATKAPSRPNTAEAVPNMALYMPSNVQQADASAQADVSNTQSRASSSRSTHSTHVDQQQQTQAASQPKSQGGPQESQYIIPGLRAIDVQAEQGPGMSYKLLRVYMDTTQQDKKAYLGGFRNKRSGVVYHHACTQTPKQPKYANAQPKLERQTQTVQIKTRSGQTVREAGTQMERPGVVIDTSYDVVKTPGRYQTSEERLAIVEAATRMIQRWWRGYLGRKRAAYLKEKKIEREAFLREQEAKAQSAAEQYRKKEIERRMHPRTAEDFEILYNELEAWRLQETRKIKQAQLAGDKEHELLQQLLAKETKLLQTIDRLKINANQENKDLRVQRTLGDMSKPKQMELKNGKKVEVHTPFTTRAKELMQLYNGLNLTNLSIDERLDVLLHVKWTVKEFDCNLTREIVSLIDREADLLNRGRSPAMMEGLRKRISSMFLNFIETPEFNPESARYQVVPMDFERYMFQKLEKSTAKTEVMISAGSKWDV